MRILVLLAVLLAPPVRADTLVAARTLAARTILTEADLHLTADDTAGAADSAQAAVGLELRSAVYAGRPILTDNLRPPAVVERNAIVTVVFSRAGLTIRAEGRALDRAGAGEVVKVMNMSSRTTIHGRVADDGAVWVTE